MLFPSGFALQQATPLAQGHLTHVLIGVEVDGRVIDGRMRGGGGRGRSHHSRRGGGARGGCGGGVSEGGVAGGGARLLGRSGWGEGRRGGGDGGFGTDRSDGVSRSAEGPSRLIISNAGGAGGGPRRLADGHRLYDLLRFLLQK